MIRGTTPTHIFEIPFDSKIIKELKISYAQHNIIIVEKNIEDCVLDGNSISVKLTQRDTLNFSHKRPVEIQIKVLTVSDTVMATTISEVPVGRVLNEEVLI